MTQPTITTRPDRPDEVFIHLPKFTYFDSQAWEADLGIPAEALPALRDAITAHLNALSPSPQRAERREKGGHTSTTGTIADLPPLPEALLQQPLPMPEHVAGPGPLGIFGGTLRFHCPLNCGWSHDENPGADAAVEPIRIVLPAGWTPQDLSAAVSGQAEARAVAFDGRVKGALWDHYATDCPRIDDCSAPLPPPVQEAVDEARNQWATRYGYPPEQPPVQWVTDDEAGRLLLSGQAVDESITRMEEPQHGDV